MNRYRRIAAAVVGAGALWSISFGSIGNAGATALAHRATAAAPRHGGTVVISSTGATSLDPISPLWPTGSSYGYQIYGALFDPTGTSGATLAPDLATSYRYSDSFRTLTLTIRRGVKFQDGTAFDSQAVKYNIMRDAGTVSDVSQYFTNLSSVTTPNKYTVVVHLSVPDTNLASVFADTNAGFIVSPTAVASEGSQFGLYPIGAGAFKVTSNNPTEEQVLMAWPGYYDAKHRYLNELEYLNTGNDANVTYNQLASGAVQSFTMIGLADPPNVINEAAANGSLSLVKGPNLVYTFLPINTNKPPFNNILAREAIDYCTNRDQIAKDVQGGWATSAPILAGPSEEYYPGGGSLAAANKLLPYQTDVAKGTALVHQLGGLSFTFNVLPGQTQVIATALAQQWAQCGIQATQNLTQFGQIFQDYATGNYQLATQINGGIFNPAIYVPLYSVPTAADDKYGFNSPLVTSLLQSTNLAARSAALTGIWKKVFQAEDQLAVNIPIVTADNLYVNNHCLKGLGYIEAGVIFRNAYYTCTP